MAWLTLSPVKYYAKRAGQNKSGLPDCLAEKNSIPRQKNKNANYDPDNLTDAMV